MLKKHMLFETSDEMVKVLFEYAGEIYDPKVYEFRRKQDNKMFALGDLLKRYEKGQLQSPFK